jgi:hypothetical protein
VITVLKIKDKILFSQHKNHYFYNQAKILGKIIKILEVIALNNQQKFI